MNYFYVAFITYFFGLFVGGIAICSEASSDKGVSNKERLIVLFWPISGTIIIASIFLYPLYILFKFDRPEQKIPRAKIVKKV